MNLTSGHIFPDTAERARVLQQLRQDIVKNLAPFQHQTETSRLVATYWFTNEFSISSKDPNVRLVDSYNRIPPRKTLSEYRTAVITGEGGILQGLPELAAHSDMTIQVDCDPMPLLLTAYFLEELRGLETYIDKHQLLDRVLKRFQQENPQITPRQIHKIRDKFERYAANMSRCVFSTPERFAEFKRCQNHPVQQVCLSYYSKEAMSELSKTLRQYGAVVHFFNPSNVCEYPMQFYQANPYQGEVADIDPSLYMRMLPFSDDAVCAYSQLFGSEFFTRTCSHIEMGEHLYATAMNRLDRELRQMAKKYNQVPIDKRAVKVWEDNDRTLQRSTKLFLATAQHPDQPHCEWMLRLTAARLSPTAIQELKEYQQVIKAIAFDNQDKAASSTNPPLVLRILDQIIADSSTNRTSQNQQEPVV